MSSSVACVPEEVERAQRYWVFENDCSVTVAVSMGVPAIEGEKMLFRNGVIEPGASLTLHGDGRDDLEVWVWAMPDSDIVFKRTLDANGGTIAFSGADCVRIEG